MRRCSVCKKKYEKGRNMFSVPKNNEDRRKWGEICGIDFKPNSQVCSDHFLPSSLVRVGKAVCLVPNAEPFGIEITQIGDENWVEVPPRDICENLDGKNTSIAPNNSGNKVFKNHCNEYHQNLAKANGIKIVPQLQEEPIIDVMVTKPTPCVGFTQTNTKFCGIVEIIDLSDELRLNCFYCAQAFPLEKWKTFANHLKEKHFKAKERLKTTKYISNYVPPDRKSTPPTDTTRKTVIHNSKAHTPALRDPLDSTNVLVEAISCQPNEKKITSKEIFLSTNLNETELKMPVYLKTNELSSSNKMETKHSPKVTALSRCLKRTDVVRKRVEAKELYKLGSIDIIQKNITEIVFEYTPQNVVDSLLDSMKNYPVLWQFDEVPYNEKFYEAIEDLCKIVNDKCSLNIDHLNMRRSINRILRFYCYLYPKDNIENVDQFTHYYDKCATFLPDLVTEIAYARCTHCYICYKNDFDLKSHLLEEYKYLQWPYKCVKCKESFVEIDDYEFHVCLPHYNVRFKCEKCDKIFVRRNRYEAHVARFHKNEGEFKCNICDKVFKTRAYLKNHKIIHGERKYKCHLCPNTYYNTGKLNLHLKLHRREYNYMCEFCGKKVFSQSLLKQHMKRHTGEKITCNICNLKLRKSSLKRHLKLLHVAYEGTIETTLKGRHANYRRLIKSSPFRERRKRSRANNYDCKICEMSFENYELVLEHNKELHPDIPKWSCKMCIMDFSLKKGLKRHYRRKHNLEQIQIWKLVDENEDLNLVLDYDIEYLDEAAKISVSKNNGRKSNDRESVESNLLLDDIVVIEDEDPILESVDILTEDDFFSEFLEE